jgi:site-specific recombinase XerD
MNIQTYLQSLYKSSTAASYYLEWLDFESFVHQLNISVKDIDYQLLLDYVEALQKRNLKPVSINRKLLIIELVFKHLLPNQANPVKGFRVKHQGRKPILEPLEVIDLQSFLNNFSTESIYQKRNHLILGLIHYQALRVGEIKALEIKHLEIEKALINVPKVGRNKSRILQLTALQIVGIQDYLSSVRPQLLQYKTNQLFITGGASKRLNNSIMKLQKRVKKQLPKLQNLEHWRTSIIVHWLENSPLLEVQNRLGHCYPSSTERYKIHAVKSLREQLDVHHPLQASWESETLQ